MLDELAAIDTSAIEELTTIKAEQELLLSRIEAMEDKRDEVSEAVFERVQRDYRSRHDALEQQARPLKERARREYATLRELHASSESSLEAAKLDKEELEFRNSLGEFEKDEFASRLAECEQRLEQCGEELAEAERLRERFIEAFHSAEELEAPLEDAAGSVDEVGEEEAEEPEPADELEPADVEAVETGDDTEAAEEDAAAGPPPLDTGATEPGVALDDENASDASPPGPPPLDAGATEVGFRMDAGATEVGVAMDSGVTEAGRALDEEETTEGPDAPGPGPDDGEPEGATMVLRGARLQAIFDDGSSEEFVLGVEPTPIGRAPDNAIRLIGDTISRYHAQVVMDADGYLLRDLGSENGTLVNGQRVSEHRLAAGDEVQVGPVLLVFNDD